MKNHIRNLLLVPLVFLLNIFPMHGQTNADAIQFSDPQFEAQLRSKVEKGWYWLPNYSGKDYIFKSGDFQSLSYLSLDSDYPAVSSLTDLQHFPMLNSIYIWDASKISDFSPIWNLKDQLEYLAINGSINADLSGVATMSKLRSIDLDGNQLKNLSLLGNYSQLQDLDLVGNHLDLSDSGIQATLSNFRSLIQTNRSNQGQWWYSEAVEVEPQMPKSFQNLSAEILRVQSGNDPQSNLLKGIHALLQIVESTEAHSLKEFAVAVGVDPSIRQLTLSDLPTLENYSHTLNRDLNSSKLAELFQNSIIPSLEQVDAHFAKIPSGSVIKLSQDLTGTEDEVTVDYADVLVLRSIVNLLSTLASMQSAYDWGANAGFLDDLDENPDPTIEITAESLRAHNSNFGGIRDAGQLVKAKDFLDKVIAHYGQASSLLRDSARLDNSRITGQAAPDRLFVLSSQDLFEEREFRDALDELSKAINGTYELKDDDWGLNKMLVSGGVPSSSKPFTIEAVNGSGNREIRIKLLSWYWGWGGSELIIRDATSKIVYNGTLSGASESSEIISLPANQSYTVEVLEGSNSWNSNSKFWEIHYYDSVVQSTDDDIIAESETIDLSQFFAGKLDLAALLPASKGNDFTTDIVTDPTMAGLFPQFTQVRVTNELTKAKLVPGEFEVSVTIVGAGHVTGDGVYPEGSYVGLLAKPYAGYAFTGWSGDASGGNNPLTLRAYGYTKKNLVANFAQVSTTSQWKWHGSFPWVYSHGENSWWYMKAGANGNFLAWKQKDKKWYSFDEASQTWIVISGQGSQDNKAGDTFTIPDLSLEMLWVAPGTFDMGSPTDEVGRKSTETQHRVTLTKGFYLGKYEVTQAQYEKVMTGNVDGLSATPSSFGGNPNRPVEQVSWSDVQVFLTRLNAQQSGKIPEGWAYVLPTEAQWEYACRAGTTTAYSWGNIISSFNTNFQYSGFGQTRDIGQYAANPWGFYDMHGNVWEWTADWFVSHSSDSVSDPQGSVSGSSRVRRGGSWHSVGSNLRSARRHKSLPSTPRDNLGFRLGFEMQ